MSDNIGKMDNVDELSEPKNESVDIDFKELNLDEKTELRLKECLDCKPPLSDQLFDEKLKEQKQRRHFRNLMFWAFFLLLVGQYVALIIFVNKAFEAGYIMELQPLLAIIIPATLGETFAIHKTMVNFVFSPGDFEDRSKSNQNKNS